ncbi:MAG: AAA family ATPase, partial [Deltaproteobacteria bacterium]|nr:AAA family ATPase [Deltaproteobacteria bacterium]
MLSKFIKGLSRKHGTRVVVLIDEYDAPVTNNLSKLKLAQDNREVLRDFYSILKSCDEYLRFVFVTGVTRYAFMGLSAGLNQLNDLTFDENFAGVCGFTIDEFDDCFQEWLSYCLNTLTIKGRIAPNST